MRTFLGCFVSLSALAAATPALAQNEPASAFTINGSATLVTDYRFRGISQTGKRFAVQGSATLTHESGVYLSFWGSSIDDYVAAGSDQEIDLIAGFRKTFNGTTVDAGVLYYHYPGSGGANTDFVEPYLAVSHTLGPVTAKVTGAYAPKARALSVGSGKEDNLYLAADLLAGIPNTPFAVSAHLGHSFGPSYMTIGKGYTDWSAGATYTWRALTVGISYVDTNKALFAPSGRNISKGGVVGSIGVSF